MSARDDRPGQANPHARTAPGMQREHDACGVGFVARATGERSHEIVRMALQAVARVAHRGAASTDNSGDGAGVLTQIPHRLFHREAVPTRTPVATGPALRRRRLLPAHRP